MNNKTALISITDKTNLDLLVKGLLDNGYEIVATTSTYKAIRDLGFKAKSIEEITSFPEMLGGRVKTLQPEVHGGILADLSKEDHQEDLKKHKISPISVVVCNLYPFEEVLNKYKDDASDHHDELIENIDIGGITLIRAASKNNKYVSLLCDPSDYEDFIHRLENNQVDDNYRLYLAAKGFKTSANYDKLISSYFNKITKKEKTLRYGENPQQSASFVENDKKTSHSLNTSDILQGKELSYNNILDIDAAYQAIYEFDDLTCIALKHNTPCGIGFGNTTLNAYVNAFNVDPVSIFGGIVITNGIVDDDAAKEMEKTFLEIIIAPEFTPQAKEVLSKKKNLRLVQGDFNKENVDFTQTRSVSGGQLTQSYLSQPIELNNVTSKSIEPFRLDQLERLYKAVRHVKSNAVIIGQEDYILGISGGQVSRVDALDKAINNAIKNTNYNSDVALFLASDGFFPFNDVVDYCKQYNIRYIIQPGGSKNDEALIQACNENNIGMIFTNVRYFKH